MRDWARLLAIGDSDAWDEASHDATVGNISAFLKVGDLVDFTTEYDVGIVENKGYQDALVSLGGFTKDMKEFISDAHYDMNDVNPDEDGLADYDEVKDVIDQLKIDWEGIRNDWYVENSGDH